MKTVAILASIVSIGYGAFECQESNTWVQLPSLPEMTGETGSAVIDDNLYVAGEANTDTYKYSFNNSKWSTVAKRIYAGNHQNSFVLDGEWWLVGGIDENSYGKVQIYTPSTNKWRENPSLPWDGGSVCVTLINKVIYACGGVWLFDNGQNRGGTNTTNKCAKFDTSSSENKWEMLDNMPYRRNHAATGQDNKNQMWIIGGREGKNVPSDGYPTIQIYNPSTNKWVTSNDTDSDLEVMPIGRGGTGHAVYNNGKFYVFGGETGDNPGGYATPNKVYNRTDIYDTSSNKWSSGKTMPHPRHGIFPVLYKDAIYIAGGGLHNGYNVSSVFDKYCI